MEIQKTTEVNEGLKLPLKKDFSLKMFALTSVDKTIEELVKDKIYLTLSIGYSPADAVTGAIQALTQSGKDPSLFKIPYQFLMKEMSDVIDMPEQPGLSISESNEGKVIEEEPKEKTNQDMVAYVRFIFETVGTPEEQKVAKLVIKKFEDYAKKLGQK